MQSLFLLMLKLSHLVTGNFFNLESKPCCCDPRSLQQFLFVHLFFASVRTGLCLILHVSYPRHGISHFSKDLVPLVGNGT